MMNLLDRLYEKIEVFRLEKRYMQRRNRDTPRAQYVDGEYIYAAGTGSYSAQCSAGPSDAEGDAVENPGKSRLSRRLSKMGLEKMDWKKTREERRRSRPGRRDIKWDWDERA